MWCGTAHKLANKVPLSDEEMLDLHHGYDHGNYTSAYEICDYQDTLEEHEDKSEAWHIGYMLGFFSSDEIEEIGDDEIAGDVEYNRDLIRRNPNIGIAVD